VVNVLVYIPTSSADLGENLSDEISLSSWKNKDERNGTGVIKAVPRSVGKMYSFDVA